MLVYHSVDYIDKDEGVGECIVDMEKDTAWYQKNGQMKWVWKFLMLN